MSQDLHTVSVVAGSALAFLDRLKFGLLASVAIPGPVGPVTSLAVQNPGAGFTAVPTLTITDIASGHGTGATAAATVGADPSPGVAAAGSGYAPDDTITLTGATGTEPVVTVNTTQFVSASVNAAGTGFVPGDTQALTGGTALTPASVTVTHTKVVSAAIANAGSGGTNGTQTVTGTTGTGTPFQASVTVAGNIITAVNSISVAGDYTVNPTNILNEPVTGGGLTGAALSVVMGAKTVAVLAAGEFTANAASFTAAAITGAGAGMTLNTTSFGVKSARTTTKGALTVIAANPVAQGSTSGSGTSATFNLTYNLVSAAITVAGVDYTSPQVAVSGGTPGTNAVVAASTNEPGEPVEIAVAFPDLPIDKNGNAVYAAVATPSVPCSCSIGQKTQTGMVITLRPLTTTEAIGAGTVDLMIAA